MWCSTSILILLGYVTSQEVTEDQYSSKVGHLREIPRRFEVTGGNSMDMFTKYVKDIQKIAHENNLTVLYKVKVDVSKPDTKKRRQLKKITFKSKKIKSKKYNVPLKKQSMKLSNFEIIIKKLAEENGLRNKKIDDIHLDDTTDKTQQPQIYYNNKIVKVLKFKPIVSRVKTNFTKIVKPVRNRIITLSAAQN
ncbi:uncharacterized protein LOC128672632 isoform X2 [Plodia interpunctella]|uniref:uncharacterized protein LOC128672632 isoform X2 n=1 Tax=Plodia interpunctella TaxID=58824 RepID=UPI002368146F|nr:uncharacterized protein LOC128672632 isoform X2 [Plodia interpunctella]